MTEVVAMTLYGEIFVPATLMHHRQGPEVEALLQDAGLLPVGAQDRRWHLDAERSGYVLRYSFALTLEP